MLALSSPLPMQGCFFRAAPARLTTSLYVSVSRRLSGSGIAFCSEGFRPAASTNSDSSSASSSSSSSSSSPSASPPSHYAPRQSDADQVQGSVLRTTLAPLPSSSRSDAFWSNFDDSPASPGENFRSVGSRSEPSRSSIPGKFSKYSKPISKAHTANAAKRAERRDKKAFRKPMGDIGAEPDRNVVDAASTSSSSTHLSAAEKRKVGLSADSVDQIPEWMKNYKFSYTETPSAPIVGFRQTPWSPFGPSDMVLRPWTGRAPLQPSKKKRGEFDSFNPPPAGKKGVKYVQKPGPFLPGEGPKQAKSREEILGAPLTPLEIQELVHTVNKGNKQLNLGRDGLTHNMLDVIHKHWKRSVVCKIKCKGVPTIDMDNVARVIEEKTGGVIISRTGGVIYLFRGRNYNYKDRPDIPVMLWKPPDPIYPRLIQAVPEGLTEEEAKTLRAKGRKVAPMCRLSKNGVYMTLVADVKAQFEIDDVVRVDCQGMHATDYKKIGAKLKELVPCTLLSFEKEQIIMCRKRPVSDAIDNHDSEDSLALGESGDESNTLGSTGLQEQVLVKPEHALEPVRAGNGGSVIENDPDPVHSEVDDLADDEDLERASGVSSEGHEGAELQLDRLPDLTTDITDTTSEYAVSVMEKNFDPVSISQDGSVERVASLSATTGSDHKAPFGGDTLRQVDFENSAPDLVNAEMSSGDGVNRDNFVSGLMEAPFVDIDNLWQSAIDEGKAIELDNQNVDADDVLKKAAQLSGVTDAVDKEETMRLEEETKAAEESRVKARMPATSPFDVSSKRGLGLDELAKLLAP